MVMPKEIGDMTLYSVEELAALLEKSENTIRRYFREGILKGKKLGKEWYVTEEALQAFFQEPEPSQGQKSSIRRCERCGEVLMPDGSCPNVECPGFDGEAIY